MTEPQVRGTDRNEATERLHKMRLTEIRDGLRHSLELQHRYIFEEAERRADMLLDAALDWESRRTVERAVREALAVVDGTTPLSIGEPLVQRCLTHVRHALMLDEVAALDPATPGEEQ